MDVLNRLIPRPNGNNGGGFKRLKHSSKLSNDSGVQSADDFFAIGGPSNGLDISADECDQFALIPATNSPKIELALVPKKIEEKIKSTEIGPQNGKIMPWKNGKEKKKSEKESKTEQNGRLTEEKSCEPKSFQPNPPIEKGGNGGGRRCRTLLGSIFPGNNNKKQEKINGGRLNLSMSEPKLNFIGNGFMANKNCGQFIDEWEGQHQVNVHGDRHLLYEEVEHKGIVEEFDGGKKKEKNKKLATMAGAFQKVREKLPNKFGTNPNNNNNSSVSSSLSNSLNSSSSSPSSSSSFSRSSIPNGIGRSKTVANGFNQQSNQINGETGKGATNTPTLAKLRKHAKIMDIVGKKEKGNGNKNGNDLDGNRGNSTNANNQQSRKPIDAQHLLLFEESLAMD